MSALVGVLSVFTLTVCLIGLMVFNLAVNIMVLSELWRLHSHSIAITYAVSVVISFAVNYLTGRWMSAFAKRIVDHLEKK